MFAALRLAVLRGVDVRVLIPSRPAHRIVYAASSLFAFEAVRAGVRMFRYQPGFLHQKVVLVDDGSSDGTSQALQNIFTYNEFQVVRHETNRGKGHAVKNGDQAIRYRAL